MPKKAPVTLATVRRIFADLPGVDEGPCYGTPGFRVRKRFLARIWDDAETLVVKCGDDERDFRLRSEPDTYFVTDHYRGYPAVLVRLGRIREPALRELLELTWRREASKKQIAELEARR